MAKATLYVTGWFSIWIALIFKGQPSCRFEMTDCDIFVLLYNDPASPSLNWNSKYGNSVLYSTHRNAMRRQKLQYPAQMKSFVIQDDSRAVFLNLLVLQHMIYYIGSALQHLRIIDAAVDGPVAQATEEYAAKIRVPSSYRLINQLAVIGSYTHPPTHTYMSIEDRRPHSNRIKR